MKVSSYDVLFLISIYLKHAWNRCRRVCVWRCTFINSACGWSISISSQSVSSMLSEPLSRPIKLTSDNACLPMLSDQFDLSSITVAQQKRHIYPMFDLCWPTVYDVGPTLVKHWVDVSWMLGRHVTHISDRYRYGLLFTVVVPWLSIWLPAFCSHCHTMCNTRYN